MGISIPKASFPGIVEIRAELARIDRAISSARRITEDDWVPGAGVSSNKVTIGPCFTSVISPLILKSDNGSTSRFTDRETMEIFNMVYC